MSNTYKLTYFNLTGRAETIRLIFNASGTKFEDARITGPTWAQLKPTTPWGGLPILEVNGSVVLGQSMAIARYVARETGLGGGSTLEVALVDSVAETINEVREKFFSFIMEKDEAKKTAAIEDFTNNFLPQYLTKIDKFLVANKDGKGFLVGDKLTWADLHLFATVDVIRELQPKVAEVVNNYPRVLQLTERVAATPKIAEYLKARGK